MRVRERLREVIGREGAVATTLSLLYLALGGGLWLLAPSVGLVLLLVGAATFAVFLLVERMTRRQRVLQPVPIAPARHRRRRR
jgi:multisubunit Na+/H+ antiporter MnhB subunit